MPSVTNLKNKCKICHILHTNSFHVLITKHVITIDSNEFLTFSSMILLCMCLIEMVYDSISSLSIVTIYLKIWNRQVNQPIHNPLDLFLITASIFTIRCNGVTSPVSVWLLHLCMMYVWWTEMNWYPSYSFPVMFKEKLALLNLSKHPTSYLRFEKLNIGDFRYLKLL